LVDIIKALFFDLFFTLITPKYNSYKNEYDVLGITKDTWEFYAENDVLYHERALGKIKDEKEIIKKIVALMPFHVTEQQQREILILRQNRMKGALMSVDRRILEALTLLHQKDIKLCLISNADIIDRAYWTMSPLSCIFDEAIFSCDIGILKPDKKIYDYAMRCLNVKSNESIFIGDGGSDELNGAKQAGMKTVFAEYLEKKSMAKMRNLLSDSDYHIDRFEELVNII
jgi:putative hydrolase of the HAD superfamily